VVHPALVHEYARQPSSPGRACLNLPIRVSSLRSINAPSPRGMRKPCLATFDSLRTVTDVMLYDTEALRRATSNGLRDVSKHKHVGLLDFVKESSYKGNEL
jgi:hypothetical protein